MAPPGQRDQGTEQRHSADKGFRPVDRVEHPDEFRVLARPAELLADDAVLGEAHFDQRPHRRFGGAVGGGDRAQIGFVVDLDRLAEIRADRRPRRIGQRCRQCQMIVEAGQRREPISGFAGRR